MKGKTVNKTLCGALTAIMLISLLMMPQAVNALEPTNLCLGKTATATARTMISMLMRMPEVFCLRGTSCSYNASFIVICFLSSNL